MRISQNYPNVAHKEFFYFHVFISYDFDLHKRKTKRSIHWKLYISHIDYVSILFCCVYRVSTVDGLPNLFPRVSRVGCKRARAQFSATTTATATTALLDDCVMNRSLAVELMKCELRFWELSAELSAQNNAVGVAVDVRVAAGARFNSELTARC